VRVLPSLLSLLLVSPGCLVDYVVGDPGQPNNPGGKQRIDRDNDGFTEGEGDCNDNEALQAPGRLEECDTLDNNCNGLVDWGESELNPCAESVRKVQSLRADVLIVMDVSKTMEAHVSTAAAGAVEMIKHLVGKGRDTHIGVITSDMEPPGEDEPADGEGRLVEKQFEGGGVRRYIKGSDDFFEASIWLSLAVGDHVLMDSGKEGLRDAVDASIDSHMDGWNSSFFRSDAKLSIVLITNDEDHSDLQNGDLGTTLSLYTGGEDVSIHGLLQLDQHCGGLNSSASLHELVMMTGGLEEDICMESYEGFLSGVGQTIAQNALNTEIALLTPAVPETVKIYLQEGDDPKYPWLGDIAISADGLKVYLIDDDVYDSIPPGTTIIVEYSRVPTPPPGY
jgi:hypothetical protein